MSDESEVVVVTMQFDAAEPQSLAAALARYVVLTRGHEGCRNVDLCGSAATSARFLVIQKWDSAESQRAHFDSADMIEMAQACRGLLTDPPDIQLWDGVSAHDLR